MLGSSDVITHHLIRARNVVVKACIKVVHRDGFSKQLNREPMAAGTLVNDSEKI
jgi:hypothetical protein